MAGKGQSGALTDMQLARKIRQLIYFVGLLHTSLSLSLSPSLSLDFYPTRIVSKCGPHILSLSLSRYASFVGRSGGEESSKIVHEF